MSQKTRQASLDLDGQISHRPRSVLVNLQDRQLRQRFIRQGQNSKRPRCVPVNLQDLQLHQIFTQQITEDDIHRISGLISNEWKPFARELGLENEKIKSFAEKENFRERAHAMLIAFMQKEGKRATKKRVAQALKHKTVDRKDIADLLQGTRKDHNASNVGYFSEESKLSQYRTTTENLTNGDAIMDQFNKEKLEPLLADIAEELGGCWKDVGRQLLSKECLIENINEDYNKVREKSYQMLIQWKKEKGTKASITDIFKCLSHIGRKDIAKKLLAYLPEVIARACEMVLLEKQLRLQDDEEVINDKQLSLKRRTLRKTNDFLKDLEFKEETVNSLKTIIKQLQHKLHVEHMTFCEKDLKCSNCEKTAIMRELLDKDLSLLHYELVHMIRGSRRLSVSGIPTDRIYDLAERTYKVCEEHKKFHEKVSKITKLPQRRCSMKLVDDESDIQYEKDQFEDPLQSILNILHHFTKKRKVTQSMRINKPRKPSSRKVKTRQRSYSEGDTTGANKAQNLK